MNSMDPVSSLTRPPSRRDQLRGGDHRSSSFDSSAASVKGKERMALISSSSAALPHHDSLMPNGPQTVRSAMEAPDNKRLSAITNEDQTDSKRNSQVSTTSTNASSRGRQRKTHIGPWELGSDVGKGGCGRVRKVRHCMTHEIAAVKIISKKDADKSRAESLADLINRTKKDPSRGFGKVMPLGIEREIVIMKLLAHDNVVKLYDVWENRHELYLVMEYVEGGELFDYVEQEAYLEEDETVWLFRQILAALLHCDRLGIHHRDLKPENILLDHKTKSVKLVDFGMAALQPKGRKLTTACGSIHYAAPEVFEKRYDGDKADVWSLGIILFVMLTGTTPFHYDPEEHEKDVNVWYVILKRAKIEAPPNGVILSEEAVDLISHMLDPNPKTRLTLEDIWYHDFLHIYANEWHETEESRKLSNWIGERPVVGEWTLKRQSDLDTEILGNLRTLWHSEKEEVLIQNLLSDEPNQEKYFYCALEKHRDDQLENYNPGSDVLSISNSDYHHIKPSVQKVDIAPVPIAPEPTTATVSRTKSQFSILNNEHLSRSSFLEPPTSERSYDPCRASRDPITTGKDGYTIVTVHKRGTSEHSSNLGTRPASRHGTSLRVEALKNEQRRLSTVSSSVSLRSSSTRRQSKASNARSVRTISRSSLGSSLMASSPPIVRPAMKHKRAVNFSHLRRSSTASAIASPSLTGSAIASPSLTGTTTSRRSSHKAEHHSADISDPLSSPQLLGSDQIRSRKGKEASTRTRPQRSQTHSQIIESEARKVSVELEQYMDNRFNARSSTGSSHATSVTGDRSAYDSPPSSVSNRFSSQSANALVTPPSKQRPLPGIPPETPNTYLTRELLAMRQRLADRAAADSGASDQSYTRAISQLDSLIEAGSAADARNALSPGDRGSDFFSTLPAISEEDKGTEAGGKRISKESTAPTSAGSNPVRAIAAQAWDRNAEATIRVIEPSSPYHPAPLNIRKHSGAPTASHRPSPLDTLRYYHENVTALPQRVVRVNTPTSPTHLNTFDEPPSESNPSRTGEVPVVQKKRSWWRRITPTSAEQRKVTRTTPDEAKEDEKSPKSPKSPRFDRYFKRRSSGSGSSNSGPMLDASKAPDLAPALPGKRPGFLRFLFRTPKVPLAQGSPGEAGANVDDSSPITPTSTHFSTTMSERGRTQTRGQNHSLEATEYSQPQELGVQRGWLARFLNIKPASRILCFQTTRGRARQEVFRLLRSWRTHGIRDMILDKHRNLIFGRVDPTNSLGLKGVEFVIEFFVVLQQEQRKGLSAARFTQRQGAASSFRRLASEVESNMSNKGLLIKNKGMKKEIEAVIHGEAGG